MLTDADRKAIQDGARRCGEPLPCGIRDRKWDAHVCWLHWDHPDLDSPCRCEVCDPDEGE